MTNLLLDPLTRSYRLCAKIVHAATRAATPALEPIGAIVASARSAVIHAPSVVAGVAEHMADRMPPAFADRLPATAAEVDALGARVSRLETELAASTTATVRPAAKRSAAKRSATAAAVAPKRSRV